MNSKRQLYFGTTAQVCSATKLHSGLFKYSWQEFVSVSWQNGEFYNNVTSVSCNVAILVKYKVVVRTLKILKIFSIINWTFDVSYTRTPILNGICTAVFHACSCVRFSVELKSLVKNGSFWGQNMSNFDIMLTTRDYPWIQWNYLPDLLEIYTIRFTGCRSQWPRGLRLRSAAARLLRLWVRSHRRHGCLLWVLYGIR